MARPAADTMPMQPGAIRAPGARQRRRIVATALGSIVATYIAFAVGAPWLLHDAPPDSYAIVAGEAACIAAAHGSPGCEQFVR